MRWKLIYGRQRGKQTLFYPRLLQSRVTVPALVMTRPPTKPMSPLPFGLVQVERQGLAGG